MQWVCNEEVSKMTNKAYASVVTFKAFSLPNGNIDGDQVDANTGDES